MSFDPLVPVDRDAIRELMRAHDLCPTHFGRKIGVSDQTVFNWLAQHTQHTKPTQRMRLSKGIAIAAAFNCRIDCTTGKISTGIRTKSSPIPLAGETSIILGYPLPTEPASQEFLDALAKAVKKFSEDRANAEKAVLPALAAIQHLMASHGHTLTVEQRAAVRGWLGRTA